MIKAGQFRKNLPFHYQELLHDIILFRLRLTIFLCIFLVPSFSFLDFKIYPYLAPLFLKIRILDCIIMIFLVGLSIFKSTKKYTFQFLYIATGLLCSSFSLMVYLGDGSNSSYYSGVNPVFLGTGFINSFYYKYNIILCLSQIFIYNVAMLLNNSIFNLVNFCFSNYFLFSTVLFIVLMAEFPGRQH